MKITKLGHSCLLIEANGEAALFDPGGWADRGLIDVVIHIDSIVYTHEHPDHFDVEILRALVEKFPNVTVYSNQQIADKITAASFQVTAKEQSESVVSFYSPHEALPLPDVAAPAENGYHFKGLFTHPGDSQSFAETKAVLAMPFIGPWGKTGDSIKKVLELKPKYVLPIHDWHYTDEAKMWLQGVLEVAFAESGIILLPNEKGRVIILEDVA